MFQLMKREALKVLLPIDWRVIILFIVLAIGVVLGAVLRQPAVLSANLETAAVKVSFERYKATQAEQYKEAVKARDTAFRTMQTRIGEINEEYRVREAQYQRDNSSLRSSLARERVLRQKLESVVSAAPVGTPPGEDHEAAPDGVVLSPAAERVVRIVEDADKVLLQAQECQAYVQEVHLLFGD